jgi:hypothetical protein
MASGAKVIQSRWIDFANGGSLTGVTEPLKNPTGGYARSIRTKKIGPFEYEIFSEAKIAERVENGTKELDMKKTHPYGPRSRMSKKTGYPYVIIPFRWGSPENGDGDRVGFGKSIITAGVYNKQLLDKSFKASRVTASPNTSDKTPNAHGQMVGRGRYSWGSRLNMEQIINNAEPDVSINQMFNMNGMVRFENGLDKNGNIGGKRYGGYFTFRIISANPESKSWKQNKWIRPATPGVPVTKIVAEKTQEDIEKMVESGIMEDFKL